jgi:hypothetical protein
MRKVKLSQSSRKFFSGLFITIFATMVGVIGGIYITDRMEINKTKNRASEGLNRIKDEIKSNHKTLEKLNRVHRQLKDHLSFLNKYMNENDELVVPSMDMRAFQNKYPNAIELADSIRVSENVYQYRGDMHFDLESVASFSISNIAWESFSQGNLVASINYDCAYYLNLLQNMQEEVIRENNKLFTSLRTDFLSKSQRVPVIRQISYSVEIERALLNIYSDCESSLTDCL